MCLEGYSKEGSCLLLLRALYGLRRSPILWLKEFSKTLQELGLEEVSGEPCLFTNNWLILFFYVDDIVVLCRKEHLPRLDEFEKRLEARYEIRSLGDLNWFLGIRIVRDRQVKKVWLCQDSYIDKIATKFHLEYHKLAYTLLPPSDLLPYEETATPQQIYAYQQRVGSINFAAVITRLDVAFTASRLATFLCNPSPAHLAAADQTITYLFRTRTYGIEYSAPIEGNQQQIFLCASDAAFADDHQTRKSTGGSLYMLFGGPIDWQSVKQKTVTTSRTEAELLALSYAAKETI
jgi:Reverse transcriptase (RNA-dependent DNA polymerase)